MLPGSREFEEKLSKKSIVMKNQSFNKAINNFTYHQISKNEEINTQIIQKINESKVIVIDTHFYNNNEYIIVCFDLHLIIIERCHQSIIQTVFSKTNEDKFFLVPKSSNQNHIFKEEIDSFKKVFQINGQYERSILNFFKIIQPCMSAYFIKKGYINSYTDRVNDYAKKIEKTRRPNIYSKNEFISLRWIKTTPSSSIYIRYHIEREKIFIAKIYHDDEKFKLINREILNYTSTNFPFLPKFYGHIDDDYEKSIIIEYVNGQTLNELIRNQLNFNHKIMIIIEILYIFQYLHRKKFIYRDLKPDNLIVDQNNYVVLIDFDRMITKNNIENHTADLNSKFIAPEVVQENYKPSFENDIYSIGKMILFIFNSNSEFQNKYPKIYEIANQCMNENLLKRPTLNELIKYFNSFILTINNVSLKKSVEKRLSKLTLIDIYSCVVDEQDEESKYFLDYTYYEGKYIIENIKKSLYHLLLSINLKEFYYQYIIGYMYDIEKYVNRDVNKLMHYLSLAAEKNHPDAQFRLGCFYDDDNRTIPDYIKAFNYISQSVKQNHIHAQCQLGFMYYFGKYVVKNIDKAIYYFKLSAEKNQDTSLLILFNIYFSPEYARQDINQAFYYLFSASHQKISYAQYHLGLLYFEGKYVKKDINKAIEYFSLAAEQDHEKAENDLVAQNNLGIAFYYAENNIPRDEQRAVHYFTLAADQGLSESQAQLGGIYCFGCKNVPRDIKKSIYYLTLAANQNHSDAQLTLGNIYFTGEYVEKNIEKSIHYYTLSAENNNPKSQWFLGSLYYHGFSGVHININKAIHYLSLSANQNEPDSQYLLGLIYYQGYYIKREIKLSIKYMKMAAQNYNVKAQLFLGDLYFEGKYVKHDIKLAIKYYKEASSFNNHYAKNNLGIIYKNGFNFVEQNCSIAKMYFKEAIRQKNDCISMFNLANILLDEKKQENAIKLLIESASQEYIKSMALLGHIFAKKYEKIEFNIIKNIFAKYNKKCNDIVDDIYSLAYRIQRTNNIFERKKYEIDFILLRKMELIYLHKFEYPLQYLEETNDKIVQEKQQIKDIDEKFYEGLGFDIFIS